MYLFILVSSTRTCFYSFCRLKVTYLVPLLPVNYNYKCNSTDKCSSLYHWCVQETLVSSTEMFYSNHVAIKQTFVSNFRPRGLYQDRQFTLTHTTLHPSCLLYSVYYGWHHRPPETACALIHDVRIGALSKVSHTHQWFRWMLQPWGDKVFNFLIQMSSIKRRKALLLYCYMNTTSLRKNILDIL